MAWYDYIKQALGIQPRTRELLHEITANLNTRILASEDGAVIQFINFIDCDSNPNYPEAKKGHKWIVGLAGKIGGASGSSVETGDSIICIEDSDGGTEAQVGDEFRIGQVNIVGAVTGPDKSTNNAVARFDEATGKIIQNSLVTVDDSGSINIPAGQSYKINDVDILSAKVDKVEGKELSTNDFTDDYESLMNVHMNGDVNVYVTPLAVDVEVGDTAGGWTRDVVITLKNKAGAEVLSWFNGKLPISLSENTVGDGVSAFSGASPVSGGLVTFTDGVATVTVESSGTWAIGDTNTVTVSGPILGWSITSGENQSVESVIDNV